LGFLLVRVPHAVSEIFHKLETMNAGCHVGPYTSVGDNTVIRDAEVENTIVMGDCRIECKKRITDSLIGRNTQVTDSGSSLPRASRFIIGENTFISL
jgi:glucose-1-phosphate thymidylyltransferase